MDSTTQLSFLTVNVSYLMSLISMQGLLPSCVSMTTMLDNIACKKINVEVRWRLEFDRLTLNLPHIPFSIISKAIDEINYTHTNLEDIQLLQVIYIGGTCAKNVNSLPVPALLLLALFGIENTVYQQTSLSGVCHLKGCLKFRLHYSLKV